MSKAMRVIRELSSWGLAGDEWEARQDKAELERLVAKGWVLRDPWRANPQVKFYPAATDFAQDTIEVYQKFLMGLPYELYHEVKLAGVDESCFYVEWEKGESEPDMEALEWLFEGLGLSYFAFRRLMREHCERGDRVERGFGFGERVWQYKRVNFRDVFTVGVTS